MLMRVPFEWALLGRPSPQSSLLSTIFILQKPILLSLHRLTINLPSIYELSMSYANETPFENSIASQTMIKKIGMAGESTSKSLERPAYSLRYNMPKQCS